MSHSNLETFIFFELFVGNTNAFKYGKPRVDQVSLMVLPTYISRKKKSLSGDTTWDLNCTVNIFAGGLMCSGRTHHDFG